MVIVVVAAGVVGLGGWFVWVPQYRPPLHAGEQLGIDVSSHQGAIDWRRVKADGVTFSYIKATEGTTYTDPSYAANWRDAAAAGVTRGAYHFFTLCTTGIEQAQHFLTVAPPDTTALPPAVDLEIAGNCATRPAAAVVRRELHDFVDAVESATGRPLVLYVGNDFQTTYGIDLDRPRWAPRWLRRPSTAWTVWQASGRGSIDGIKGSVDLDVAHSPF